MRTAIILTLLTTLTSCNWKKLQTDSEPHVFQVPKVLQHPTSEKLTYPINDSMPYSMYWVKNKYEFSKQIYYGSTKRYMQFVDDDKISEVILEHGADTIANDGFQIYADYATTLYAYPGNDMTPYAYFPVYVINESATTKVFVAKDSYVFAIQEAKYYRDDRWYPIESMMFDFCGNGYYGIKVHPGQFIMVMAPKYGGDSKGMMRVRMRIGESTYFSQPFEGTYNEGQFNVTKENMFNHWPTNDNVAACNRFFLGATPLIR